MCLVKTPKIKQDPDANKPLPILRNALLDGIDPSTRSLRIGRQSLRIDRNGLGNPAPASGSSAPTAATAATPFPSAPPAYLAPPARVRMGAPEDIR